MKELSIAVIGVGRIGLMHASIVHRAQGAKLAGIVDRKQRRERICEADESLADVKIYARAEDAFADDEVDAVLIASSTPTHADFVRAAAAGGKHVLCEKPVAFCAADIRALADELKASDRIVRVAFNRRFDPGFARLRDSLRAGMGKVFMINITNHDPKLPPPEFAKSSGGMFADFNVHDFDMLRFLTGAKITNIFARGGALVSEQTKANGDIDSALLSMELANGAFASVHCCRQSGRGYDQRIEVLGEKGMMFLRNPAHNVVAHANDAGETMSNPPPDFVARFAQSYRLQLQAFIRACARGGGDEMPMLEDAAEAIAISEAAQQSLQTGNAVNLF